MPRIFFQKKAKFDLLLLPGRSKVSGKLDFQGNFDPHASAIIRKANTSVL